MLGFKEVKKRKKEKIEGKVKTKGVKHQELLNHLEIKPSGEPISITPLKNGDIKPQKKA